MPRNTEIVSSTDNSAILTGQIRLINALSLKKYLLNSASVVAKITFIVPRDNAGLRISDG